MSSENPTQNGNQAERGTLIVVSAPSGAGKSSLAERVLKRVEGLRFSISYTTRQPRGSDSDRIGRNWCKLVLQRGEESTCACGWSGDKRRRHRASRRTRIQTEK